MPTTLKNFVVHLRLPFQLMLAPFFLLGSLLAARPGAFGAEWFVAFVAVHVGLYGGATVFNSYYDADEGPIGFLKRPPPVEPWSYVASLYLQLAALVALLVVSWRAAVLGLVMVAMGIAYSHPRWRWKSRLHVGLVCVGVGQGALAVLLGYYATGGSGAPPTVTSVALAATLLVLGLYPLTQIYQIAEDAARGDQTMPVRYGWRVAMLFSAIVSCAGVGLLLWSMNAVVSWPGRVSWVLIWLLTMAVMGLYLWRWSRRFAVQSSEANHDAAIGLSLMVAIPVSALVIYQIWEHVR